MKYFLNKISRSNFFNQLNLKIESVKNSKLSLMEIEDDIQNYLKNYILPDIDVFLEIMNEYKYSLFNSFKSNSNTEFLEYERKDLYEKLIMMKDYLSIIENFDKPKEFLILDGITDKSDFLLTKLNSLFNDNFYSASLIFQLNDIDFRIGEPREIAENLHKREYLILQKEYGELDNSKLTIKGAKYIERKNKSKNKEKNKAIKDSDLNNRLDKIREHLEKLGLGQQIIFDEIEELRELQTKLSKKSWTQLLKGKLFDLAVEEILSKEVVNEVFEFLTNSTTKLLK